MNTDQAVIITGAGSGIGRSLCLELAKRGYKVWGLDINEQALLNLKEEGTLKNLSLETLVVDIKDTKKIEWFLSEVLKKSHHLHAWINCAGISGVGHFHEMTDESTQRVIDINLTSVINACRLALKTMEVHGTGTIVNLASIAGHVPAAYLTAYTASKHAIVGFTRALEIELKNRMSPIRTLLVSPGYVETGMIYSDNRFSFPDWLKFCLASPESVAVEIANALPTKKREIYPSWNGKLILALSKVVPGFAEQGSKMMLAKSLKDYLLNRYSA